MDAVPVVVKARSAVTRQETLVKYLTFIRHAESHREAEPPAALL
jgi:hypothetical protein